MYDRRLILSAAYLLLSAPGSACAGDGTLLGTGFGAIIGGALGSQVTHGSGQFLTTSIGVATGAVLGNDIGQSFDAVSRTTYPASQDYSYDTSSTTMLSYAYTPNYVAPPAPPPIYADPSARTYCRPFSQRVLIDGFIRESYGTACLQPDGSWRVVP